MDADSTAVELGFAGEHCGWDFMNVIEIGSGVECDFNMWQLRYNCSIQL